MNLSKTIHPSVFEKIDAIEFKLMSSSTDPEMQKVASKHIAIWSKTYGWDFGLKSAGFAALIIGSIVAHEQIASLDLRWMVAASLVGAIVWLISYLMKHRRIVAPEELENLLPVLELDDTERTYCEAMIELDRNRLFNENGKEEIATELNSLMSAYLKGREQMTAVETLTEQGQAAKIKLEQKRADLGSETDPEARSMMQDSIDILERQAKEAGTADALHRKVRAQHDYVQLALADLRARLRQLSAETSHVSGEERVANEVSDLRDRVREASGRVEEIERAIQEIRA
jgi:hypothetical protein